MANSAVTITATKSAMLSGGQATAIIPPIYNSNAPDSISTQAFSAGTFASVTVPTGAQGVIIIPPTNNAGTITFKGVTGDTGVNLSKTQPNPITLDTGATFGLLCSANTTIEFWWF